MAKVIYICSRNRPFNSNDERKIHKICMELEPDNLPSSVQHKVFVNNKIIWGIMNYYSSIVQKNNSLLLGYIYDNNIGWEEPLSEFPDGSYGLFRDNHDYLEIVSDPSGSRTIWYYFDDKVFISSTSQRAIVMFLGSFVFDERVIPWMLSTGSLGPEFSWDMRLKKLGPDSSVILDKMDWSISINKKINKFIEKNQTDGEHHIILTDAKKSISNKIATKAY